MGKRYNPFPDPKKGKGRMVLKKPAGVKSASWSKVPYQRHKLGGGFLRKDQTKWRRNIQQLLKATDNQILDMLMKDKFLPNWEGCVCPFCNEGVLGPLSDRPSRDTKAYRCNKKNCQKYVSPAHLHPLFTVLRGPEGHSLQVQATALLLRLAGVPLATIHLLTNINHKAIERLNSNLNFLRGGHVTQVEKTIKFGGAPKAWRDVEVDEACFDKRTLKPWEQTEKDAQQGKNTEWEQWGGLVQRGCPKSLVLFKLRPAITVPRAPGPGAIRKVDWTPVAQKWLNNRRVILHSDSARSYRSKVDGVLHDAVVHKKRRVKKGNKWVWVKPVYVKISAHKLPDGTVIKTKGGTQIIDRAWRFIKDRLRLNQHGKASSKQLAAQIRSEVHSTSTGTATRICGYAQASSWMSTCEALSPSLSARGSARLGSLLLAYEHRLA